jgi:CRISPR-associated protein Cmr5
MAEHSLDQLRAAYAWDVVSKAPKNDDFKNLATSAPALIMGSGLMQTLAFYQEKGKDHHRAVVQGVLDWLAKKEQPLAGKNRFDTAMTALQSSDADTYLRATEEALEVLKWIRQFAKATIGKEP